MEFWIDTANETFIEDIAKYELTSGVTTNPTIAAVSNTPLDKLISQLLKIQNGKVAVQVISDDYASIIVQAEILQAISKRIIVKIPVIQTGLRAIQHLSRKGVNVLATAIFEPRQALLAFKAGAQYLAPYMGKIQDYGNDPLEVLQQMVDMKKHYQFPGKIMAAGIRETETVTRCAEMGVCAITLPEKILSDYLADYEGTEKALVQFAEDWKKAPRTEIFNDFAMN